MGTLVRLLNGLAHLASPRTCRVCGQTLTVSESVLCLGCLLGLPRTGVHRSDFNDIHRRLGHHIMVDRAAGWFYYSKGTPYAQMLIDSKYADMPAIDYRLGRICASELSTDSFFDGIDLIVPMPMYWLKRMRRGYNQAEEICRGISEVTGIPYAAVLRSVRSHGTQSRHSRQQRHTSLTGTMSLGSDADIQGRHILLVDDIITTGASCIEALKTLAAGAPSAISVLSLGLTKENY